MIRRLFRWSLVLLLVLLAAFGGFAWTVVHPPITAPWQPATPDAEQKLWSFGFVGDTHAGMSDGVVDQIFAKLAGEELEFVLHLGDMVDQGESEGQWQQFVDQVRQHRLRLLPVVGNHDIMSAYSDRGDIRLRRHFPWLPATYYHFRHRNLNFLMLNSELSLVPGSRQRHFLSEQLQMHPGTAVVCLHRPVFTCSPRDWANKYWRQIWLQSALTSTEATLVVSGHNHYYERTRPLDDITYLTSGGGTSNVYSGQQPNGQTAVLVEGKPHYGVADVYADYIDVQLRGLDDELLDQFAIEIRPPHHQPGHQRNPGSIELPPIAEWRGYPDDASADETALPTDQLPRPW